MRFNLGIPWYYPMSRRLFGPGIKYPLLRLGHLPERLLRRRLYLDSSNGAKARYIVPDSVPIPDHTYRPELPVLDG
jgi:hypothetical protein